MYSWIKWKFLKTDSSGIKVTRVPLGWSVLASLNSFVRRPLANSALFTSVPEGGDFEIAAKGVYRFGPYPIQPNRFLKCFAVVFGAGIDLAYYIDHLSQRNPAAEVPD